MRRILLTTMWGRGYKLSDDFYQQWVQGTQDQNAQIYYTTMN